MYGIKRCLLACCFLLVFTAESAEVIQVLTYKQTPYVTVEQGKAKGMIVELVEELFSRAGLVYEIRLSPLKRILVTSEINEHHCALPIERSQEREINYKWVSPVLVSRYGLFSSNIASIPLKTLMDAKSYVLGSFLGSGISEYLQQLGFQVEVTARSEQNIKMLQLKRIDLWAADVVSAKKQMEDIGVDFGKPELVFFSSIRAMACNNAIKDADLLRLQSSLTSMYQDGFMVKLYQKFQIEF